MNSRLFRSSIGTRRARIDDPRRDRSWLRQIAVLLGLALSVTLVDAAEKRWALNPPRAMAPPVCKDLAWSRNPIDAFILDRLEREGLRPTSEGSRLVLLRRAYLDVVGLPPGPEDIEAFLDDSRPDAYERMIDRLLTSPHHGERWGRHWLDVARYADTSGFETDLNYPTAWRFRDFVIRSFNADKPFDRFVQEQVAGDELWPSDADAVTASSFYCIGPALPESAMVETQLDYEWLTDATDTTGSAFLGLTFGCARCHDHKYDPISQNDYFAMQAIFAASDRPYPAMIRLAKIKTLNGLLSEAKVPDSLLEDPRCTVEVEDRTGFRLFHRREPMEVHRLHRGEIGKPREKVAPALPSALVSSRDRADLSKVPSSKRRAAFAQWLTSSENPLSARVLVNRVWAWHFGEGLVRTPGDFGFQGEEPTHPELLDWLATDLMGHGWSLKRLHRLILTSSTYRMASAATGAGLKTDPENRLLWHFPRLRLGGEAIRDAMLDCAGRLNHELFGPPVVPPLGKEELTGLFDAKGKWPVTKDAREHDRRSVYLLVRRTFAYPLFATFDPPEVMASCPRRMRTIVPTQALALFNSPLARGLAAAFAHRLLADCGGEAEHLVERAWLLAFSRPVTTTVRDHALAFLKARTVALRGRQGTAQSFLATEDALADLCLALFNANEFIYVD